MGSLRWRAETNDPLLYVENLMRLKAEVDACTVELVGSVGMIELEGGRKEVEPVGSFREIRPR